MDAGEPGALRRAVLEAALPGHLRVTYPGWRIWEDHAGWHAHRRGNFRQEYEPGALLFAVHASSPAGLWALLILETEKEQPRSAMAVDAGDCDHGQGAPPRPSRRVHKQGSRRGGAPTERSGLRLL